MKKYTVLIDTENTTQMQRSVKFFINKVDALNYAKGLFKLGIPVNINVDTYKKGICIKNEFGRFDGIKTNIYSVINYRETKQKIVIKYNPSDYFNEAPDEIKILTL